MKLRKTFVFRPFLLCISKMKRICTNMENEADLTSRTNQTPTTQLKSHLLQAMQPETVWMDGWIDGRIAGLAASVFRVPHSLKSIRVFFVSFSSLFFEKSSLHLLHCTKKCIPYTPLISFLFDCFALCFLCVSESYSGSGSCSRSAFVSHLVFTF